MIVFSQKRVNALSKCMHVCLQTDMKANISAVFGFSDVINVYGTKCKYFVPHWATKWVKFATHLQANEFWGGLVF